MYTKYNKLLHKKKSQYLFQTSLFPHTLMFPGLQFIDDE